MSLQFKATVCMHNLSENDESPYYCELKEVAIGSDGRCTRYEELA